LPDHLKFFQGHLFFQRNTVDYFNVRPQEGRIGHRKSEVGISIPIKLI